MSEINESAAENLADKADAPTAGAVSVATTPDAVPLTEAPAEPKQARPAPVASAKAAASVKSSKPARPAKAAPRKIAAPRKPVASSQLKEKTMPKNAKIAEGIKEVVVDAQAKARKAVAKGSSLFGEAGQFTKGNVEAVVESGKILATGLQALGKEFVAEGRSTIETVTGEVKQLAAVRSPGDLLKVQSEIARKNLDAAIAMSSKNSEAVLKLASDVFAPISGRFSLAAEKIRKIAA